VPTVLQNGQRATLAAPQSGQIGQSASTGADGTVSAIATASEQLCDGGIIAKHSRRWLPVKPRTNGDGVYIDPERLSARPRGTGGRFILPTEYELLKLLFQPLAKVHIRHQANADGNIPTFLGEGPGRRFRLRLCVHLRSLLSYFVRHAPFIQVQPHFPYQLETALMRFRHMFPDRIAVYIGISPSGP
jgi:hypothetical protein